MRTKRMGRSVLGGSHVNAEDGKIGELRQQAKPEISRDAGDDYGWLAGGHSLRVMES